jgi:hypothetical protein
MPVCEPAREESRPLGRGTHGSEDRGVRLGETTAELSQVGLRRRKAPAASITRTPIMVVPSLIWPGNSDYVVSDLRSV